MEYKILQTKRCKFLLILTLKAFSQLGCQLRRSPVPKRGHENCAQNTGGLQREITAPNEIESSQRASDSSDSPQTWGRGQEKEWSVAFGEMGLFAISVHGVNKDLSMQGSERGNTDTKSQNQKIIWVGKDF